MTEHRFFAAIYDQLLAGSEKGGPREMRAALLPLIVGSARPVS